MERNHWNDGIDARYSLGIRKRSVSIRIGESVLEFTAQYQTTFLISRKLSLARWFSNALNSLFVN